MLQLALRNLGFYWRGNLAVLLGVAVGAAVLIGALFVGDSLRGSLAERAARQTDGVTASWVGARLINERLPHDLGVVPAIILRGTLRNDANGRVSRVTVIGLDNEGLRAFGIAEETWSGNIALLGANLAVNLGAKDDARLRLSVQQISTVPRGSLLGRRELDDLTTSLSLTMRSQVSTAAADFSLTPSTEAPMNLFVPLQFLQDRLGKANRVNAMFSFNESGAALNKHLTTSLQPSDWGLKIAVAPSRGAYVSVESDQLILNPTVVNAVETAAKDLNLHSERTTVYLANWIAASDKERIPYSVVAALDANAADPLGPFLPAGKTILNDDEIVLTDWPASPLKNVLIGSTVTLSYFKPEVESGAVEASHAFKLVGRIPMSGVALDPDLTPPFPGITDKLRIGDWNPPFPFEASRIKAGDVNEQYWDKYKTTPKAYISRAAGEKLFASRYGITTSIRIAPASGETPQQAATKLTEKLQQTLNAKSLGIHFEDTRERMAKASVGGTDFGGLFLGFSFFLILAALGLVGLLVRLAITRRARDLGSLLAMGYTPKAIRRSLLIEGAMIAVLGTLLGLLLAIAYSHGLIALLVDLWPDTTIKTLLHPHQSATSAIAGSIATIVMAMLAIVLGVRGLLKLPIPMLLRGQTEVQPGAEKSRSRWLGSYMIIVAAIVLGLLALIVGPSQSNPDFRAMAFFAAGGMFFVAGLLMIRRRLIAPSQSHFPLRSAKGSALLQLGFLQAKRFPSRSLLTVFLLGSATFLLVAVESFRRKPDQDFSARTGGSGGFNLLAQSDVPLFHPFDREPGRGDFLDLYEKELQRNQSGLLPLAEADQELKNITAMIPLRRHTGDDASCLNLYQSTHPTMLGVPPSLIDRGVFKFSASLATTDEERANPWLLLSKPSDDGTIPVIGEQNSIMWMLKKAVGDVIELPSEGGVLQRFRIVATLQDSVFQSELLISDAAFQKLYPRDEGFAEFLIDVPTADETNLRRVLESGLASHGMIASASRDRVASYQAIVGTYLTTFQLLGGLGLLLGVLGLAAIVLRGVWDRLGEFALLAAVGYSPRDIRTLVLAENLMLLALGLGLGVVTAVLSVWPQGGELIAQIPRLLLLLAIVTVFGFVTVVLATRSALKSPLMLALRSE